MNSSFIHHDAEAANSFIKQNKKLLIEKFASIEEHPSVEVPFSIFMAGSPGAGKTEFSKALVGIFLKMNPQKSAVRIDADDIKEIIPQYNGKNSDIIQGASALGVEKLLDHVLSKKQNAIIDGTFQNFKKSEENIERSLKRGRIVNIFYIYQDPLIAWDFTKKREVLEGRYIPKEAFVKSFFLARDNANKIKSIYGSKVSLHLIIKDYSNKLAEIKLNIQNIDSHIEMLYDHKSLILKLC